MKVLITGATGVAGSAAVAEALKQRSISSVTALTRRPLAVTDPKLRVVIHNDFLDYSNALPALKGHDAVLWCLGVSQRSVGADEYERVTFDYTLAGAKAMASVNPGIRFCHLSGGGADSKEKSRIRFVRVKGRAENALNRLDGIEVVHFRPAYIHPKEPRAAGFFSDRLLHWVAPAMERVGPSSIIAAEDLARAMLHVAEHGSGKRILENRDIRLIAGKAT